MILSSILENAESHVNAPAGTVSVGATKIDDLTETIATSKPVLVSMHDMLQALRHSSLIREQVRLED